MKLDRFTSGVVAASAALMLTFVSGCTSGTAAARAPHAPRTTASALQSSGPDSNVTGTASLMSAQMAGPAPKVGKSRLAGSAPSASDEDASDLGVGSADVADAVRRDSELPKGARRSDGSRRGGGFGSSK